MIGRLPAADATQPAVDDHAELLRQLDELSRALSDTCRMGEAVLLARRLADRLETHFRHDEEGDYLREIAVRAPHLAPLAAMLQREHPQLLERLREIEARLERREQSPQDLSQVAAEFQALATAIRSHEEEEHRLIQESFNSELGCSD